MKKGAKALDALLTLAGENRVNHDALVRLLVEKGIITENEISDATKRLYLDESIRGPADWAWHYIGPEDGQALHEFFGPPIFGPG